LHVAFIIYPNYYYCLRNWTKEEPDDILSLQYLRLIVLKSWLVLIRSDSNVTTDSLTTYVKVLALALINLSVSGYVSE